MDHNYGSVGIALLGTFTKPGENDEPGIMLPEAMERALVDVIVWQCQLHNIDPSESNDYLLVTDQWNRGIDQHRRPPRAATRRSAQAATSTTVCR